MLTNPFDYSIVNSVLNVKVLVGTFNQEKALTGAFSLIVKLRRRFGASSSNETCWFPDAQLGIKCKMGLLRYTNYKSSGTLLQNSF